MFLLPRPHTAVAVAAAPTTTPGGDGDFFHISEAKKTTLQDIVVYGLLSPKERCVGSGVQQQAQMQDQQQQQQQCPQAGSSSSNPAAPAASPAAAPGSARWKQQPRQAVVVACVAFWGVCDTAYPLAMCTHQHRHTMAARGYQLHVQHMTAQHITQLDMPVHTHPSTPPPRMQRMCLCVCYLLCMYSQTNKHSTTNQQGSPHRQAHHDWHCAPCCLLRLTVPPAAHHQPDGHHQVSVCVCVGLTGWWSHTCSV